MNKEINCILYSFIVYFSGFVVIVIVTVGQIVSCFTGCLSTLSEQSFWPRQGQVNSVSFDPKKSTVTQTLTRTACHPFSLKQYVDRRVGSSRTRCGHHPLGTVTIKFHPKRLKKATLRTSYCLESY